jgi:hypothetical protein
MIVAQAVVVRIDDGFQPSLLQCPLRRVDQDLEDRELDTLTEVATSLRYTPEPRRAVPFRGRHVVSHEHHHHPVLLFAEPGRIGVEIAAQVPGKQVRLEVRDEPERRRLLHKKVASFLLLAVLPSGEDCPTSLLH